MSLQFSCLSLHGVKLAAADPNLSFVQHNKMSSTGINTASEMTESKYLNGIVRNLFFCAPLCQFHSQEGSVNVTRMHASALPFQGWLHCQAHILTISPVWESASLPLFLLGYALIIANPVTGQRECFGNFNTKQDYDFLVHLKASKGLK